ncbi:zinc ABC transporter ATP-binding protein AztA [Nocardiopsis mangrovi]|uniref:Zinc ABC transporter ATP-binding protein AztA n=1 Tax=Nocardiopsis mangrovi TaxID=1179818 RepID=A0ABV9E148_9ACTN
MSAVVINGLWAGYGRRRVLHGVTARIPAARVTAVVGPNGSGKSTLLGAVAGVVPAAAGTIGRRTAERPALVVQRSAVADALPITVRETVSMGRWAQRGAWRRLTRRDRTVIDSCMDRLDIRHLAERPLGALSGGQRQRALVAQGLAQESDLLLLDEPATGLDVEAQQRISGALDHATRQGATVVHATHDLAAALRADHCMLITGGRVVAEGPPADVLTPGALARVWGVPQVEGEGAPGGAAR